MRKKRILMIGASWEQVPLIQKLKGLEYWVLATNPTAGGEAMAFADEARVIDPRDIPAFDALFREFGIEAIVTDNCDYSLYASGLLCWKHYLPGPNLRAILYANNKRASRLRCKEA